MTTIKLFGGDLGNETVRVRCNLTDAAAPVQVDYCEGDGWVGCQYQCGETRHRDSGLATIGKILAAQAVEMDADEFDCEWEVEPTLYEVCDCNSGDSGLTYDEAIERIGEWYEDVDQWSDGIGDDETHAAIAEAIASIEEPAEDGDLSDLQAYADAICEAVAEAMGSKSFAGHGNYYVSAADNAGLRLSVRVDD